MGTYFHSKGVHGSTKDQKENTQDMHTTHGVSLFSITNFLMMIIICFGNSRRCVLALLKQWLKMPNTACTGQYHLKKGVIVQDQGFSSFHVQWSIKLFQGLKVSSIYCKS